ncbi:4-hydroxy-tetrahydrodipicolinate synthase family protein [Nocardia bhagyanarayanae]|uniref:4-hydroxy-tetrahydrodipicolinate synthase n=1 Tax=Nocardia bhagyanarayanae TaxID=1215925 RepID=A0A543FHJ0_9NOCA|nr:4-hydroxy-tetrahydrodipicolinate synthase [Nocardia bhagyanarayanae]TQM33184.1 4-hydroxy-tetrahydrodipicolinate synthase [Nocardia bhagyanarayanae]
MHRFRGIFVPLVTPFTDDGAVAWDALESLARDVLDAGAAGLVALGTTAEAATLDAEERRGVIEVCATVCASTGAPLIVGAGGNDTRASIAGLVELAAWPQVAAALVPVPYYTRPSEAGVVAHYAHLAPSSPVPLIVYHIPYRTGRSLSASTLRELAALDGVVGVKYAVGGVDADAVELLADPPTDFAVLAGDDVFLSPLLALGAAGGIVATAQLATARFVTLESAWRTGDLGSARAIGAELAGVATTAFAEPNPTVMKGVLHALGRIPSPAVRLPLLPAAADSVDRALAALAAVPELVAR